jgi:vacuolar-type H+-ATPase subunit I/STV1
MVTAAAAASPGAYANRRSMVTPPTWSTPMPMVRMRLIGSREDADTVINALHGIDGIEHVEEVDDLSPTMRDDSSSSELVDDSEGHVYYLEVRAPNANRVDAVQSVAEFIGRERGMGVEFVEEF